MKVAAVLFALTAILGGAHAIGVANAAPHPQPETIDVNDMKLRARGSSPREY